MESWAGLVILIVFFGISVPAMVSAQPLQPVPFTDVQLQEGFWSYYLRLNREAILPHNLAYCESEKKIDNFRIAAGLKEGKHYGAPWEDSDVYKVIEGAAYCLALERDPDIERRIDEIIALIAACQQPDGYLHTYHTLTAPKERWTRDQRHELYCAGHLIEAAIAYYQATEKRTLLDVALRVADHLCEVFGPKGQVNVPEHEEIELALIKLWRFTGDERYLDMSKLFLERRGRLEGRPRLVKNGWGEAAQDHKPIREQDEIVGHAVRAMYLYSAVTDIVALTGDAGYRNALDLLWEDVTQRKMYITGGLGDSSKRNEGFSVAYFLPNETAYAETCASIGLALWGQRMALLHADARYANAVERVMYNGILSCVGLDGQGFFYCNRLAGSDRRPPWQGCACCPTNMVRFLPAIAGYAYAHDGYNIYINQYLAGKAAIALADRTVAIEQQTNYPWDGSVRITLTPETSGEFDLYLRIPGWLEGPQSKDDLYYVAGKPASGAFSVYVNGVAIERPEMVRGYVRLTREWRVGDVAELDMPMEVRRVKAHPKVEANTGRVALKRGPMVYCFEGTDNDHAVLSLAIPAGAPIASEHRPDLLNGVTVLTGTALLHEAESPEPKPVPFTAVPYYAWQNRRPGFMQVWMPEDAALARPRLKATIASRSVATTSHPNADTPDAMNDRIEPEISSDTGIPRMTWWDRRGAMEWVQYDFAEAASVCGVEVYWFDDTGFGHCRVPAAWRLLYFDENGAWQPVPAPSDYGVAPDTFNRVTFSPVMATGLRIEAELQPDFSAGILEWRVLEKP